MPGPPHHYDAYPQGGWQDQAYSAQSMPPSAAARYSGGLQQNAAPLYQTQVSHHSEQQWDHEAREFSQAQAGQYPQQPHRQLPLQRPHQLHEAGCTDQEAARLTRRTSRAGHGGGDIQQPELPAGMVNRMSSPQRSGAVPSIEPARLVQGLDGGHGGRGQQFYPSQRLQGGNAQQAWPMGLPAPDQPLPEDARLQGFDRDRLQQQQGRDSLPHAEYFNNGNAPFCLPL